MADYDWFDRTPTEAKLEGMEWEKKGLKPVYKDDAYTMGGQPLHISHFECMRGCGTLVWNPVAHIKNVCTEWSPDDAD